MRACTLIVALVLFCNTAPCAAQEECTPTVIEDAAVCISNAVDACLNASSCTSADYVIVNAAEQLSSHIATLCCDKPNKRTRLACLQLAVASTRTARSIIPPEVRTEVVNGLRELITSVKSSGDCMDAGEG